MGGEVKGAAKNGDELRAPEKSEKLRLQKKAREFESKCRKMEEKRRMLEKTRKGRGVGKKSSPKVCELFLRRQQD
jgi:hypothetical protein